MTKKYKIVLDRPNCIGCYACESVCPKNWKINDDGKANFNKEILDEEEYKSNKDAEESCPVNVIHINEINEENEQ